MSKNLTVGFNYNKIINHEGRLEVPKKIIKKGKDSVREFILNEIWNNHKDIHEHDYSEWEYIGAECEGCAQSFMDDDFKIVHEDIDGFCKECDQWA